ncbi:MAG: UDP-N-acetylmuramoyl-tripeptide--D-alanyl-D-alanine ligase [Bacteroidales bacterium]|jgi:UDP-N-acetylmuramoyl-tripeptide--D-alanyl-D-alanine ligase|nr:UDP-N-acetylmuramoyl-tripeptide--D-alanyl-D-alanine ligase [Bacteroidales bacterium]
MQYLYDIYKKHRKISTDTRHIEPDCIFFCLKGDHFDGNQFAEIAAEKGAFLVVTENEALKDKAHFYYVENSLACLQQLAKYHRQQLSIPIIGITGTNGKTTTKELTAAVLSKIHHVAFTQGNLNNHIGVPLTLLSIMPQHQIAIVEMGANHCGEIEELCRIAQPTHGLITNIGTAHIEGFGSLENIIDTKTALYKSLMANQGVIFYNAKDAVLQNHVQNYMYIVPYNDMEETFSSEQRNSPFLSFNLSGKNITTHLTGNYNKVNALAAAKIGTFFNVSAAEIIEAIVDYEPKNHRSQVVYAGSNTLIADYYNANPTSMTAALTDFSSIKHAHKVAILGDMFELGAVSHIEHEKIVKLCKKLGIEAYFIGHEFKNCTNYNSFTTVSEFKEYLKMNTLTQALILVKGSRGMQLENIDFN